MGLATMGRAIGGRYDPKSLAVPWRTYNLTCYNLSEERDRHVNKSFYLNSLSVAIKVDIKS